MLNIPIYLLSIGHLGKKYENSSTLYVILKRDEEKIARSYKQRLLHSDFKASMIHAFATGIIMNSDPYLTEEDQMDVCRYYVSTVYSNIEEFVKERQHCTVQLEGDEGKSFSLFLSLIQAQGDLEGAQREFNVVHDEKKCHYQSEQSEQNSSPQGGGSRVANVRV